MKRPENKFGVETRKIFFLTYPLNQKFFYTPPLKNQIVFESHETYKYQVLGRNSKKNFSYNIPHSKISLYKAVHSSDLLILNYFPLIIFSIVIF